MPEPPVYEGGCHCGAVRFRVRIRDSTAIDCNCSICRMKGFLHLIVDPRDFELLRGEDALLTYTFHTRTAKHRFCCHCGIHPFYTPRSHPDAVDVNLRCLDASIQHAFRIEPFDGAHWDDNIHRLR